MGCGCGDCEELMQPYMDKMLSPEEEAEAKQHLEDCPPCDRRFKFEEELRQFVRVATDEPMPDSLREKLSALRTAPPS
jgi:mycothiol system anti-sigma-R factor